MNKKLVWLGIIVIFLSIAYSVNATDTINSCNAAGYIHCEDASNAPYCAHPGISYNICYVLGHQTVNISQTQGYFDTTKGEFISPPSLSSWNFNKFILRADARIQFLNTNSFNAAAGMDGTGRWFPEKTINREKRDVSKDPFSITIGGAGTCGGINVRGMAADGNGGSGGQGGNGGKMFVSGGLSGIGGWGTSGGPPGVDIPTGLAGANVQITAGEIEFSSYTDYSLSVSGEDGNAGQTAPKNTDSAYSGGGGGAGGVGGSGAGRIIIISNKFIGTDAMIVANGGNGGSGGNGGNGRDNSDGGGGGGGSGGQFGQIYIYSNVDTLPNWLKVSKKGGLGGNPGNAFETYTYANCDKGEPGIAGVAAPDDPSGLEFTPSEISSLGPEVGCTNNADNDLDGFVDFADKDCWSSASVDAFKNEGTDIAGPITPADFSKVFGRYTILNKNWWDPKSVTGADGVCGDDIPTGIDSVTSFEDDTGCNTENWICHQAYFVGNPATPGPVPCIFSSKAHLGKCSIELHNFVNDNHDYMFYYSDFPSVNSVWVYVIEQGTVTLQSYTATAPGPSAVSKSHDVWELLTISGTGIKNLLIEYKGNSKAYIDDVFGGSWVFADETGYITRDTSAPPRTQYLCYDNTANDIKNYNWLDAMRVKYKIKTIKTPKGEVDAVSNSQDWFYCNATGTNQLNGKPIIAEGSYALDSTDNTYSCMEMAEAYFAKKEGYNVLSVDVKPLAAASAEGDVFCKGRQPLDSFTSCGCEVIIHGGWGALDLPDFNVPPVGSNGLSSGDADILKELCLFDTFSCLSDGFKFSPIRSCEQNALDNKDLLGNPFNNAGLCNSDNNVCLKGMLVNTSDSNSANNNLCCFGKKATCVLKEQVNTSTTTACALSGGEVFEKTGSDYICTGSSLKITGNTYCCFGGTLNIPSSKYFAQSINPASFRCFKNADDNIISQCCYDSSCKNSDYVAGEWSLGYYSNRVTSLGSVQNTIASFDSFNPSGGQILDHVHKYFFPANSPAGGGLYNSSISFISGRILASYSYLEFDTAYSADVVFSLNGIPMGALGDYSTNGNESNRWHHIVINTKDFVSKNPTVSKFFDSVVFYPAYTGYPTGYVINVIIDNVILTPLGDDLQHTSQNSYCTGGFEGWIDDLDPTPTSPDFFKIWENYGPYMLTCNGIGPYTWTGKYCCGDDTKLNNYGEYYNDTLFGCFGGTELQNDWTVSYAKNKQGDAYYTYKDLLYYNNTFMGCQVPLGKYTSLDVSYDGTNKLGDLVSGNTIAVQCAVIGSHYCMNNAWKEDFNVGGLTPLKLANQVIKLKTSPAGPNLIKNGFSPDLLGGTS